MDSWQHLPYVTAAYIVGFGGFLAYGMFLWMRIRSLRARLRTGPGKGE